MKRLYVRQQYNSIGATERYVYIVTKVKNSTTPEIGAKLSKAEIDLMCESKKWTVDIS